MGSWRLWLAGRSWMLRVLTGGRRWCRQWPSIKTLRNKTLSASHNSCWVVNRRTVKPHLYRRRRKPSLGAKGLERRGIYGSEYPPPWHAIHLQYLTALCASTKLEKSTSNTLKHCNKVGGALPPLDHSLGGMCPYCPTASGASAAKFQYRPTLCSLQLGRG